jgi:hypothetical protein
MFSNPSLKKQSPYIATFLLSLLLSYIAIATDGFINHDGVFYGDAAKQLLRNGVAAAFQAYQWPFFSFLIAGVHTVTGLSIEASAHLINILFLSISCLLFLKIYQKITFGHGSLWVAAFLILNLVGISTYREDIMRDFGYWCFFLAGFYSLLTYLEFPRWRTAMLFQLFMLLGFLFRVEAVAVMALAPFAVFLKEGSLKEKLKQIWPLYSIYLLLIAGVVLAYFVVGHSGSGVPLGRLPSIVSYLSLDNFTSSFHELVLKMGEIFHYDGGRLNKFYGTLAILVVVAVMTYIVLKAVVCMGVLYTALFCYGLYSKALVINLYNRVILYFALFFYLTFWAYTVQLSIISPRYTTTLVLMLLLLLAQMVEVMLPKLRGFKHGRKVIIAAAVILIVNTLDEVISLHGHRSNYIKHAAYWVRDNVDRSYLVYSNNEKAVYYSDRIGAPWRSMYYTRPLDELVQSIENGKITSPSHLIVIIPKKKSEEIVLQLSSLEGEKRISKLKEFKNKREDRAAVFELVPGG